MFTPTNDGTWGPCLPSLGVTGAATLQQRLLHAIRIADVERRMAAGEFFVDRFTSFLATGATNNHNSLDGNPGGLPRQNGTQSDASISLPGLNAPNANNLLQNNGLPNLVNPLHFASLDPQLALDPVLKAAQLAMKDYCNAVYPQAQSDLTVSPFPPNFSCASGLNSNGFPRPEEIVSNVGPSMATNAGTEVATTEVAEPPNANGSIVATTPNINGIIEALREAENKVRLKENARESPKPFIPHIGRGEQLKSLGKGIRESRPLPTNTVKTPSMDKHSRHIPNGRTGEQLESQTSPWRLCIPVATNTDDEDQKKERKEEHPKKKMEGQPQPPDLTEEEEGSDHDECTEGGPVVPGPMDVIVGRGSQSRNKPGLVIMRQILQKHQKRYDSLNKAERFPLSNSILLMLKEKNVRFVKKGRDGKFRLLSYHASIHKVTAAFRNMRINVPSSNANKVFVQRMERMRRGKELT